MTVLAELAYSREYNRTRYGMDRAETIAAKYAPSANAMLIEWRRLSGVMPGIRFPNGGARTKQQCLNLGLHWSISDHYEDAGDRAALDVDNRGEIVIGIMRKQRVSYARAGQIYYDVAARMGWHNITTDGRPFSIEPWHLANHDPTPTGAAGATATLITMESTSMDYRQIKTQGDPAQYADFNGLVIDTKLSPATASIRRSGRSVKVIDRKVGESASKWLARRAAVLADWERERAANLTALKVAP